MKNDEKNRDPERARKRAKSDLRCAARKLGLEETMNALADLFGASAIYDSIHDVEPEAERGIA